MLRRWRDPSGEDWTITLGYVTMLADESQEPVQMTRVRFQAESEDMIIMTRRRITTLSLLSDEEILFLLDRAKAERDGEGGE